MTITRRSALAGALFAAAPAFAQSWPARPIRFVVPFAAGAGVLDIMARIVGQHLTERLGQQVVVDNQPGRRRQCRRRHRRPRPRPTATPC